MPAAGSIYNNLVLVSRAIRASHECGSFQEPRRWTTLALYDADVEQQKVWFGATLELSDVPIEEEVPQEDD